MAQSQQSQCDSCVYFEYEEETDTYVCSKSLDEDEYEAFASKSVRSCPYYVLYDEYKTVRKQN